MRKDLKRSSSSEPAGEHTIAFRGGGYSLVITAIMLALLIVVNIFASALPTSMTKYDISASKLYSITSNTKVVVNALEEDVTIYWIVQSGKEDEVIENLLSKYESLSDHIEIVKKNPDVFPTFAEQYTDETVSNNSLVVECGEVNHQSFRLSLNGALPSPQAPQSAPLNAAGSSDTMTSTSRKRTCIPTPIILPLMERGPSPPRSIMW